MCTRRAPRSAYAPTTARDNGSPSRKRPIWCEETLQRVAPHAFELWRYTTLRTVAPPPQSRTERDVACNERRGERKTSRSPAKDTCSSAVGPRPDREPVRDSGRWKDAEAGERRDHPAFDGADGGGAAFGRAQDADRQVLGIRCPRFVFRDR